MSGQAPEWELKDWASESRLAALRDPRRAWIRRAITTVISVAAHLLIFLALMATQPPPTPIIPPEPIEVALMKMPPKEEAPKGPAKGPAPAKKVAPPKAKPTPKPKPPKPLARRLVARAVPPAPTKVVPLDAGEVDDIPAPPQPSSAQLAGATTAESGGGGAGGTGRNCNMVRWLQNKLRSDPAVHAALNEAHRSDWAGGRPVWVWNGDWVRSPGQEGPGLAVVREAVIWEVGFAPEACRADTMRGLVVISMSDAPGAAKLAIGSGQWRWTDLLHARGVRR
jgi:hypothetical protein